MGGRRRNLDGTGKEQDVVATGGGGVANKRFGSAPSRPTWLHEAGAGRPTGMPAVGLGYIGSQDNSAANNQRSRASDVPRLRCRGWRPRPVLDELDGAGDR